tara:strand:- start:749 stop:1006 length:258 start_codon:yes stop_codon:yes gene_type:complete
MSELSRLKKENALLKIKNNCIENKLKFYKSIFKTHRNSVVFQLKIKKKDGMPVWVDRIRNERSFIESLDRDSEIEEWLKPVRCER